MCNLVVLWLASCLMLGEALPVEETTEGVNLLKALRVGHPLFSYSRETTTLTQTYITTQWLPSVVCARLVNVTGPCKTRIRPDGQIPDIEEPVVLTFDDDMDEADALMVAPTKTLKVEPTAAPEDFESKATMRLEASRTDTADGSDGSLSSDELRGSFMYQPFTTKTVFIMNCTPDPFNGFPMCPRGPRGPRREELS